MIWLVISKCPHIYDGSQMPTLGQPVDQPIDQPAGEPINLPVDRAAVQRRVLAVLTGTQILAGAGLATGIAVSTLIASDLSGSETIGGLAQTASVLGAGVLALPMARLATAAGRRPALTLAYATSTAGALVALLATTLESWPLLLCGLFLVGGASAGGLASRYAATDLAGPGRAARDLSIVVWATTIGTVAGPNLASPADHLGAGLGLADNAGPYAVATAAFALAALAIATLLRPDPLRTALAAREPARSGADRAAPPPRGHAWRAIRERPAARVAVAAIVVSHMVMIAVMSMTPVHLDHGHASLTVVGMVISVHVAGMFALSPLTGWLADRLGRIEVLLIGMAQLVLAAALAGTASPHQVAQLTVALFLLGTGWSCGLVAGSALLTESVPVHRRAAVQGLSDLLMNGGAALAGLAAGAVVAVFSYGALAVVAAAFVLPVAVMLLAARRVL